MAVALYRLLSPFPYPPSKPMADAQNEAFPPTIMRLKPPPK